MTNSRKEKFAELFEHICNDEESKANELFHEIIVEMARDIHNEMMSSEENLHETELEGDMEADLAKDLDDVNPEHEAGHLDAEDAEEDLTSGMLGDDDMEMNGDEEHKDEEHGEESVEDELHAHEEHDQDTEEKVEELEDHMHDVDEELEKLKSMFAELSGDEHVAEGVEMSKVAVKMGGEAGGGHFAGTEVNTKSPSANADHVKLGGEALEMGKGEKHTSFERQEPTVKPKDMGKMVNTVKSGKDVLQKAGKESSKYLVNPKGEVGAGKSGMPIDASKDSTIGSKK